MTAADLDTLAATRRALHGVAELVLAGPQHRRTGEIRLRVLPGGFGTYTEPDLRIDGAELVAGDRRLPLTGTTGAALAASAGVEVGGPADLYSDGSGVAPDDPIDVDPAAAARLARWFAAGDEALRRLAPAEDPILWPEHFDLGVTVHEVNYGVSPGDSFSPEPYAYVGPWTAREGDFWNAPFGAVRRESELPDADAVLAFLAEGRDRASTGTTGTT